MEKTKNFKVLFLAVLMVFSAVLFAACGESGTPETVPTDGSGNAIAETDAAYRISVVDALGKPIAEELAVKFMKDGKQDAMQLVNESGVAEKVLPRDNYTVELQFTNPTVGSGYDYDASDLTLSAEKTELTVVMSQKLGEQTLTIFANGQDTEAHYVSAGCTTVTLDPEGRSYFIFTPTKPATYEFSLVGSDAVIGYYGETHYILDTNAAEVNDNKFQMSVSEDMIGATPVIGIDAAEGDAVLCIDPIGEAAWTIEQEPWITYKATVAINPYTLPAGAKLNKFDITGETKSLVFNETDGFYHIDSADGPLVLALIAKGQEAAEYTDTFEQIMENYSPRRIFYDENGNFVKKEGYVECLQQYIDASDETYGVYPLTKDLEYIIQQFGIQQGWFDESEPTYLFRDENGVNMSGINNEIAWLFMCRYLG